MRLVKPSTLRRGGERERADLDAANQGPVWVKFRPRGASELGPLFPQQQTCDDCFGMSVRCQIRTHAVQQSTLFVSSLARASNGRLMSGLRLPTDAAMASALFGLGPEAHQER